MKKVFTIQQRIRQLPTKKSAAVLLLVYIFSIPIHVLADASNNVILKESTSAANSGVVAFAGEKVTSFTLINADNDQPIQTITNGTTLYLSKLPTKNLNIRADTYPAKVGSVYFNLTGAQVHNQMQTNAPLALFGDADGDYNPWIPTNGSYTLKCTPYSGAGGSGTAGTSLTVNFTVNTGTTSVRPYVTAVRPANGTTNVSLDQSISVDLKYPGGNYINTSTVNPSTVRLYKVYSTGKVLVNGTAVNSTAAGDAVTLSATLVASTNYEFQITDGVKDDNGKSLIPFTSTIRTNSSAPRCGY